MLPVWIRQQLSCLRRRERSLRLVWGLASSLGILGLVLGLSCFTDWLVDRWYDTPRSLRIGLLIFQTLLALGLLGWWVLRPLLQPLGDSLLSLWVEQKKPEFHERLVTAVQLNQPAANTEGMSQELIESVTRSAEEESRRFDFRSVADSRRLGWSLAILAGLGVLTLGSYFLAPATTPVLLARQFLSNREIPRSVQIEAVSAPVSPLNEPTTLQFHVEGARELRGLVQVQTDSGSFETFVLEPASQAVSSLGGNYIARIPAMPEGFQYNAWLGDGRTKHPARMTFEARPAIQKQQAWVLLPSYCSLRPGGLPYEQPMEGGDLIAFSQSQARIMADLTKPVVHATLEVLGPVIEGQNQTLREIPMDLVTGPRGGEKTRAQKTFALQPGDSAYRLVVRDSHGFTNINRPQRSIVIQPDEPPVVQLLPERFARPGQRVGLDDTEMEGMPVPFRGPFWVSYRCQTPTRLDRARFRYRVLKAGEEVKPNEPPFESLALTDTLSSEAVGAFDLNQGTFEKMSFLDEIEFHAIPSSNPEEIPGRHEGGGRFVFKTSSLQNVKVGDKIEFYVEVLDSRKPALVGRSEARVKDIVEEKQLALWLQQKREETRRLQQLESRQVGVFDPKKDDPQQP